MTGKIIELEELLEKEQDRFKKIDLMNQLSYMLRRQDGRRSMELCQSAYELSEKEEYKKGLSESLHLLAIHDNFMGNYHGTLEKCDRALILMEELEDINGKIKIMNSKGFAYTRMGKVDLGLEFFLKGLELAKSIEDYRMVIFFYTNIGDTYESIMNMHKEALENFFEAFKISEEKLDGKHELHGSILMYIAESYRKLGELDEALVYAQKGLEIAKRTKDSGYEAHCNHVFGKALRDKGNIPEALKQLEQSLKIYQRIDYKYNQAELMCELAELNRKVGAFEESILFLKKSLEIAEEIEATALENNIHKELAEGYEGLGQYEMAILHYKEYIGQNAKLTSAIQEKKINAIVSAQKLEQAKKDAEIYRLRNFELKESYTNIEAISEIGRKITATQDIEEIIATIYDSICKLMDSPTFGLGLYDKYTETIDYKVFIEQSVRVRQFAVPVDEKKNFASKCVKTKQLVFCNDLEELMRKTNYLPLAAEIFEAQDPLSLAYVPLIIEDEVIGTYTVQSYKKNAYSARKLEMLEALAPFISIALNNWQRSEELKTTAAVLTDTLENLKNTQNHLINSEKMAALGQLISGVAHEINTPLGAIQASINNIADYTKGTIIEKFPSLFHMLKPEEYNLFVLMLKQTSEKSEFISTKDERSLKKELIKQLKLFGVEDSYGMADNMIDMGIYRDVERYLPLITSSHSHFILQVCYEISGIIRNANNMKEAIAKASKMIFALRNYAHFDHSDTAVEENITKGLETVLELYHNNIKHGVTLIKNYGEIPNILCYPDELNQVWTNLIHNSLQAMDYNGTLQVKTREEEGFVLVEIIDDGVGIADEIKNRIFDPFFTTKSQGEGSGLGLGIAKKIVEKHKGEIYFDSREGETIFTVKLPISNK